MADHTSSEPPYDYQPVQLLAKFQSLLDDDVFKLDARVFDLLTKEVNDLREDLKQAIKDEAPKPESLEEQILGVLQDNKDLSLGDQLQEISRKILNLEAIENKINQRFDKITARDGTLPYEKEARVNDRKDRTKEWSAELCELFAKEVKNETQGLQNRNKELGGRLKELEDSEYRLRGIEEDQAREIKKLSDENEALKKKNEELETAVGLARKEEEDKADISLAESELRWTEERTAVEDKVTELESKLKGFNDSETAQKAETARANEQCNNATKISKEIAAELEKRETELQETKEKLTQSEAKIAELHATKDNLTQFQARVAELETQLQDEKALRASENQQNQPSRPSSPNDTPATNLAEELQGFADGNASNGAMSERTDPSSLPSSESERSSSPESVHAHEPAVDPLQELQEQLDEYWYPAAIYNVLYAQTKEKADRVPQLEAQVKELPQLQEDLKKLEEQAQELPELQETLKDLKTQVENLPALERQLQELKDENAKLKENGTAAQNAVTDELKQKIAELEAKTSESKKQIDKMQGIIENNEKAYKASLEKTQKSKDELETTKAQLKTELDDAIKSRDELASKTHECDGEVCAKFRDQAIKAGEFATTQMQAVQERLPEIDELEQALRNDKDGQQPSASAGQSTDCDSEACATVRREAEELAKYAMEQMQFLRDQMAAIVDGQRAIREADETDEELRARIKVLEEEESELRQQLTEANEGIDELEDIVSACEEKREDGESKFRELEDEHDRVHQELAAVRHSRAVIQKAADTERLRRAAEDAARAQDDQDRMQAFERERTGLQNELTGALQRLEAAQQQIADLEGNVGENCPVDGVATEALERRNKELMEFGQMLLKYYRNMQAVIHKYREEKHVLVNTDVPLNVAFFEDMDNYLEADVRRLEWRLERAENSLREDPQQDEEAQRTLIRSLSRELEKYKAIIKEIQLHSRLADEAMAVSDIFNLDPDTALVEQLLEEHPEYARAAGASSTRDAAQQTDDVQPDPDVSVVTVDLLSTWPFWILMGAAAVFVVGFVAQQREKNKWSVANSYTRASWVNDERSGVTLTWEQLALVMVLNLKAFYTRA